MRAVVRGIVLDAETAALVRGGARCARLGLVFFHGTTLGDAHPGDVLLGIGGHPVAELVAEADEAKARAERLRHSAGWLHRDSPDHADVRAAADLLDHLADLLIDPRLVAAAHAQWAEDEERGR